MKAHPAQKHTQKFGKNHPSLQQNTMGRADKSALVTTAVLAIRRGEFKDYSNAAKKYHYSHTAIMRRIKGETKTWQEANSFYNQCLTNN